MRSTGAAFPLGRLLLLLSAFYCYLVQANGLLAHPKRYAAIDALDETICGLREFHHEKDHEEQWSEQQQESKKRISAGWDTVKGEFPWSVMLRLDFGHGRRALCGGSIIHRDLVLTAAHCLMHESGARPRILVRAGVIDLRDWEHVQQARGRLACLPAGYKGFQARPDRDIALIKLDRPFHYNQAVRPICVHDRSAASRSETKNCIVSGFGITDNTDPSGKEVLPQRMQGITQELCDHSTPGARQTGPTEICMVTGNKHTNPGSTCQGDSGGALACPNAQRDGRFFLEGALSRGPSICGRGHPTVSIYADVFKLRDDLFDMLMRCK